MQSDSAVSLGKSSAVGTKYERNVQVSGARQPEDVRDEDLRRGGVDQVIAAHDLPDGLGVVIHDDSKVVGGSIVCAPEDNILDDSFAWPA